MATEELQMNPFQERLMSVPETYDVFLGGGRGGGKSYAMAFLALRHCEQYGIRARVLYLRKTYKGIADFELVCRELFGKVYGTAAKYNSAEHVWTMPNGSYLELGQLETASDYAKYQGRSFTLLMVDECGQWSDLTLIDRMRSNLRGWQKIPLRVVLAGNPGGNCHQVLARRFVFVASPWTPFKDEVSKRTVVHCPSTFAGNSMIDREAYADSLQASCPDDPELYRSWSEGDWTALVSGAFSECLEEKRNAVDPWQSLPSDEDFWTLYLAIDWGSAAPSYTALVAQSPGAEWEGKYYPRGSYVIVDEVATTRPGSLTLGLNYNVSQTASVIRAMCQRWGLQMESLPCYADDSIFSNQGSNVGSIASELRRAGLMGIERAGKKDRKTGFTRVKNLLAAAGQLDRPGLYISRACSYWWNTVPFLSRDPKQPESVDGSRPDHAIDCTAYLCLARDTAEHVKVSWNG
ncbi:phage terminase large subunit [Granulicella arctica]|uniref:Phage terminase large subunit N-terminal domain-containing protein n=1 Tax=Granulicella arctica TaxID=940613 RepID=A0A7Y9PIL2_9BACT|nr:phage terminase large subunit [Granulicella arctica]NYF80569.1 hypothetical protein [Granulicella arctica]